MNKQKVIEKVKTLKPDEQDLLIYQKEKWGAYKDGFLDAKTRAELAVEELDEPKKPVLTKAEAEWVDNLTNFFSLPDALYRITRCGYGHLFTFDFWGGTYELPIEEDTDYAELNIIKERLVNAVFYGYEVKKEKLYKVSFKRNGIGIGVQQDGSFKELFAKEELKEYGFNNLDEYEVEEVEE